MQIDTNMQFLCLKTDMMFSLEDRRRETDKPKKECIASWRGGKGRSVREECVSTLERTNRVKCSLRSRKRHSVELKIV